MAASAASNQAAGSKRPRQDDVDASVHESRLLANNKFAALPVQQVAAKVKIPPLFTKSKEVGVLRNELAAKQIHPLFKLCGVGTKIICSTEEDYKAVGKLLLAQKHEPMTIPEASR